MAPATRILVAATPRAGDGSAVAVRLAGGGGERPYFVDGQHWRAGVAELPRSVRSLDFKGDALGGGGVADASEIRWAPATHAALADIANLVWADAPITVRIGPEGDALPPVAATGLVLETAVDDGQLRIALADATADLKRPLLVDRFAGTGGIEGPAEWKDRIRSRAWGRCFNVPGQVIDPASNIVCFGDPSRPWQAFDQVRDRGAAAEAGDLVQLGWQGSAAATFAALKVAATPEGGGVLCPAIACVRWWTVPGALHADVRGETAGGYVETAAEIAARIVAARSALAVTGLAAAAAARPGPFGWRVDGDGVTAAAVLSEMLAGVSLSWLVAGGEVAFRPWDWSAPVRSARSVAVTRRETVKPVGARRIGYRRNQAPMARGDIAAIVFARDVAYEDGTPVEALRPAEGGADVTGDHISKDTNAVGGTPAVDVLARFSQVPGIQERLDTFDELFGDTESAAAARAAAEEAKRLAEAAARASGDYAQASGGSAGVAEGHARTASDKSAAASAFAEVAASTSLDLLLGSYPSILDPRGRTAYAYDVADVTVGGGYPQFWPVPYITAYQAGHATPIYVHHRRGTPAIAGRTLRVTTWGFSYMVDATFAIYWNSYATQELSGVGDRYVGTAPPGEVQAITPGGTGWFRLVSEFQVPAGFQAFVLPFLAVSRPGNAALTATAHTGGLLIEDVTEGNRASASASLATTASTSALGHAEAARDERLAAKSASDESTRQAGIVRALPVRGFRPF
ncbi:MAG: hypothetical protein DI610_07130, partial [Staphylococcus hominis]